MQTKSYMDFGEFTITRFIIEKYKMLIFNNLPIISNENHLETNHSQPSDP